MGPSPIFIDDTGEAGPPRSSPVLEGMVARDLPRKVPGKIGRHLHRNTAAATNGDRC